MRRIPILVALVVALAAGVTPAATSHPKPDCSEPTLEGWNTDTASEVELDQAKVDEAIAFAMSRSSGAVAVYRYGCLIARAEGTEGSIYESWSVAKSVTSLAVGRAVTLGLLSVDDPLGKWFPEAAGTPHADVTVRQLLTMSSGVHWNFVRDYFLAGDRVADFFKLDFDHAPGTYFEYAQPPITVLTETVARASGTEFQAFVQQQLFGPLGIANDEWSWIRDERGHTMGFYGLNTEEQVFARFGELARRNGKWNGKQLIDRAYLRDAVAASPANPAYGYLFWRNASERGNIYPTIYARHVSDRRPIQTAPADTFMAAGNEDQRIWVIPSLDMVVTRFGGRAGREVDTRRTVWTSSPGEFEHEFFRLLMSAVTDTKGRKHIPESQPYEPEETVPTVTPTYGIVDSVTEPDQLIEGATTR